MPLAPADGGVNAALVTERGARPATAGPASRPPAVRRLPWPRALLLLPAAAALLLGLDAAMMLLGLPAPLTLPRLGDVHGVLLVLGFAGTLVALERAVALGSRWGYLAPAGLGAGGLALVVVPSPAVAGALLTAGAAALVAVYVPLWARQPAAAVVVQALGAVLAVGAALLWWGGVPVPHLLPWLTGFLVLTIAGERVELARVAVLDPRADPIVVGTAGLLAAGVLVGLLWPVAGAAGTGAALLATTAWLARYDVARRTVRSTGLPRFTGWALLAGYGWLAVAGGIWLLGGPVTAGPGYDAVVHAVFLGFVISIIIAHAPVILPAVLRRPLPYRPAMYAPLVLLHISLALRIAVGDLRDVGSAWQLGGLLNVSAVLLFVAVAAWSAATADRRPRRSS
ncbi:hypothetical protein ACFP6A_02985 [Quadrisphaera sp. GCM10027208]|uniref:hypothetical protein n=1 Tax=Quadrisphaera sp. GCM10027208 TaxID=3273423 RepID=UPI00361F4744